MSALTGFTLFPKLPYDVRVVIWRMAMPRERIVIIQEKIEWPDHPDDDAAAWNDELAPMQDEYDDSVRVVNRALRKYNYPWHIHSYRGQAQLERYGFTTSRTAPDFPTDGELEIQNQIHWELNRVGRFQSKTTSPVLLRVCHESRHLLQAYGYRPAFSTRTAPPRIWFNFNEDILTLPMLHESGDYDPITSEMIDSGKWNIGQLRKTDREQVKKVALSLSKYHQFGETSHDLHQAVQMFGNLEELLLVRERGAYYDRGSEAEAAGDQIIVDIQVEELWGHYLGWWPRLFDHSLHLRRFISGEHWQAGHQNFSNLTRDMERRLQDGRKGPKIRYVYITTPEIASQMAESRRRFRQFVSWLCKRRRERQSTSRRAVVRFGNGYRAEADRSYLAWIDSARGAFGIDEGCEEFEKEFDEAGEAWADAEYWSRATP